MMDTKFSGQVMYLTEILIRKRVGENPYFAKKLKISGRGSRYKIRVIENLQVVPNLVHLNLSHNNIAKISNLECLAHLRHLDLSHNLITNMDGLQTLSGLMTLNLYGNQISCIPSWVRQCLISLKTLELADNQINTIHQLLHLRGLSNLTSLTFHGNPAVEHLVMTMSDSDSESPSNAHSQQENQSSIYRLFALFHLRTLVQLDGEPVQPEDIQQAIDRFSQDEMDHMLRKLKQREDQLAELERVNLELVRGPDTQDRNLKETQHQQEIQQSKIALLEQELQAKEALLSSQTDELARACLKHYELEQELAFHKIDKKFAQFLLGPCPQVDHYDVQKVDTTGDHPYVGRCRTRLVPQGQLATYAKERTDWEQHATGPLQALFKPGSLDSHLTRAGTSCVQRGIIRPNNLLPSSKLCSSLDGPTFCEEDSAMAQAPVMVRPNSAPLHVPHTPSMATDSGIAGAGGSFSTFNRKDPAGQLRSPTCTFPSSIEEVERLTKSIVERAAVEPLSPDTERTRLLIEEALSGLRTHLIDSVRETNTNSKVTTATTPPDFKLLSRIARLESELSLVRSLGHVAVGQQHHPSDTRSSLTNVKLGQAHKVKAPSPSSKTVPSPDSLLTPARSSAHNIHQHEFISEPIPQQSAGTVDDVLESYEPHPPDVPDLVPPLDMNVHASRKLNSQSSFASQHSTPMQYSATSSAPSSRTTGTGRSVETARYKSEIDVYDTASLIKRQDSATGPEDYWSAHRQQSLENRSKIPRPTVLSLGQRVCQSRQPGVGDTRLPNTDSHSSLASPENIVIDDGKFKNHVQNHQHHPYSEGPKRSDFDQSYLVRLEDHPTTATRKQRTLAPKAHHSFPEATTHSRSKHDHQHHSTEPMSADEEKDVRFSTKQGQNSLTRTSASGTSGHGYGVGRRRRKLLRSVSTAQSPRRRRHTQYRRDHEGDNSESMSAHAEELLDLVVMSRKACAAELNKMRTDLARMQKSVPRIVRSSPDHSASSYCLPDPSFRPERVDEPVGSRPYSRTGVPNDLLSGRATVRSVADTLTNVTRPSPNGDEDEDSFDSPPSPKHSRPHRTRHQSHTRRHSRSRPRRLLPNTSEPDELYDWTITRRDYRNTGDSGSPYRTHWSSDPVEHGTYRSKHPNQMKVHSRHLSTTRGSRNFPISNERYLYEPARCSLPNRFPESSVPHHHHPAPRGRSLERQRNPHSPVHRKHSHRRPSYSKRTDEDEPPSVETAAILNLTDELLDLRQGLRRTREANSGRLGMALRQISMLELELQRQRCLQHDTHNARERQAERSRWEKRLNATLSELKQCQANIGQLRGQMDQIIEASAQGTRTQAQFERQQAELEQAQQTLDKQKEEIARVNSLLSNLLGVNPADVSPNDLQQIQTGLVELNRQVQLDNRVPPCHLNSVRRTQSMHTGLNAPRERLGNTVPGIQPLGGGSGLLRTGSTQLYCTVPEHHYLEDCLEQLQTQVNELELAQGEQQRKLRQATKAKKKLEKQIDFHSAEVDRLNAKALARQQELAKTTDDVKRLLDEKDDTQRHQQRHLITLASELSTVENAISGRRAELTKLEELMKTTEIELQAQQAQLQETNTKLTEAKSEQERASGQLANVTSELLKAKEQLCQFQVDLIRSKAEVEQTDNEKRKLQSAVEQLEGTIKTKESELERLSSSLVEAQTKLSRIDGDIASGEQRVQSQQRLMTEQKATVEEQQTELRQLAKKMTEEQRKLEALNRETDERRTELERLRIENSREVDNGTANARELTTQVAAKQRELTEAQAALTTLSHERITLTQAVESLKFERDQLRSELSAKQQSSTELTASLDRQKRELENVTDRVRSEEDRVKELTSQQRDLNAQLEQLRSQMRTETDQMRERELAKVQKTSELEATRNDADRELFDLQRLSSRQKSVETELRQLIQQRDLAKKQLERLMQKVRELERRKVELVDSISEAKLDLNRVRIDSEAESNSLEGVRNRLNADRDEYDQLSQRLDKKRTEMDLVENRLSVNYATTDAREEDLADQRRQRIELTGELTKLGEAVYTGRLAFQTANENREASELALHETLGQLDKAKEPNRRRELHNVRDRKQVEQAELEQRLSASRKQLQKASEELAKKRAELAELEEKYKETEIRLTNLGRTEAKCIELQQALTQKQAEPSNQTKDRGAPEEPVDPVLLARSLAETKSALIASQRDCKRMKRRTAKELAELERIAEEQCGRAGELTEQLSLVKHQYAQLKGQISTYGMLMDEIITIASQTELDEQGKRLEAALAAVRAELDQHPLHCLLSEAINRTTDGLTVHTHRTISLGQDVQQPSSSAQPPKCFPSSDPNMQPAVGGGLYKPRRCHRTIPELGECTPGTANNTHWTANTTATSGLGSSYLHPSSTALETNGTAQEASDVSSPDGQAPSNRDTQMESDWKRKISDRVAQQRQQAAAEWAKSDNQFSALRCQMDEVRDRLDRGAARHSKTTKQSKK